MKNSAKLLVYFVLIGLCAATFSPAVYWGGSWLAENDVLPFLKGFPFHRYFNRTAQVSALILAIPFFFWLQIRRMGDLGLERNPHWLRDLIVGFLFGSFTLAVIGVVSLGMGFYGLREAPELSKLLRITATAVGVSLFEEAFFRGLLQGILCAAMGVRWGIGLTAVLFTLAHFFRPPRDPHFPETVTAFSGFEYLGACFAFPPEMAIFVGALASLLVGGLIFSICREKTHSLWLPIGLHAGWIFYQQGFHVVAKYQVKPPLSQMPWIGPAQVSGAVPIGLLPLAALILTGLACTWYLYAFPAKNPPSGHPAS